MPLTALDAIGVTFDATDCSAEQWTAVHRSTPRAALACRSCSGSMHAKASPTGLRFFAHDQRDPSCPAAGESAAHRWLKARLADAVRSVGDWTAVIEGEPGPSDAGGWRADVLAIGASGRRVAFEVQLAAMTVEQGRERSAKYATDGVETVWVTTKDALWLYRLVGVKVAELTAVELKDDRRPLVVRRGCAELETDTRPRWRPGSGLALEPLVDGLLSGRLVAYTAGFLSEVVPFGAGERHRFHSDAVVVAPMADVDRDRRRLLVDAARRADEAEDAARRAKHIQDLYGRQQRVVAVAAAAAAEVAEPRESVWLGVPPTILRQGGSPPLAAAYGNDSTAQGAVVWIGATKATLRLFAVVCPVASRITPRLANSWGRRATRVYVEEIAEARRVARTLGWPLSALTTVNPPGSS